ncbi:hypothetical protein RB653_006659 [Dictyostelium firmibasis]|uniref:F5/8 type C domain-containing protein n=1 Tax=Dictyostelium firmibasis TaxID=79012 RepID=A0AAN7YQ94_9MYCE
MSTANLVPLCFNSLVSLRTSTNFNAVHTQFNSLLNYKNGAPNTQAGAEAWCAAINDANQFIVAGVDTPKTFVAVSIQGRGDADQWTTSFKVRYTLDGITWTDYRNGGALPGNTDRSTVVTHFFDQPIRARSISICPLTFNNQVALRFELYSQPEKHSFTQVGQGITPGSNSVLNNLAPGSYEVLVDVVFPVEFKFVPIIALTFDHLDTTSAAATGTTVYQQTRVGVTPIDITTKGFKARFYVWDGSRAYDLRADYVATSLE